MTRPSGAGKSGLFEHVLPLSHRLDRATPEQVDAAEQALGLTFPQGYREYVTELGAGWLSEFLTVLLPQDALSILEDTRDGWRVSYYWSNPEVLPLEDLLQCVSIAGTATFDALVFHPQREGCLYVLASSLNRLIEVRGDFKDAVDWLLTSGELTSPLPLAYFESEGGREQLLYASRTPVNFEDVMRALEGALEAVRVSGGERNAHLLLPELGGVFSISRQRDEQLYKTGGPCTVFVAHLQFEGGDQASDPLSRYLTVLHSLGFSPDI